MLMAVSDHELMRRLQSGDLVAFDELVCRWQRPLSHILARLYDAGSAHPQGVSAAVDCDDLTQEIFLKVYQARKRYRPTAEFSTWLYRIAINTTRDAARRNRRRPSVPLNGQSTNNGKYTTDDETSVRDIPARDDAEDLAAINERRNLVNAALQSLPTKLKEPLVLRHYTELTFPQIAEVLKVPCTTIKSRVHLALKQLEQELRRLGVHE